MPHAAGYLLERKADLGIVNTFLRPAYGEKQKEILFRMLQSARRLSINGHSISFNSQEIKGHVDNLAVVVRMYMEIVNVDAAFGVFPIPERKKCIVIGRSHVEDIDIGGIMHVMGGGGHPGAGSTMLDDVQPDAVVAWLSELIAGNQRSSVQVSDLMSFPVFTVSPEVSMAAVAALLRQKGCTGVPIVADERLVGIISRRDFRKLRKKSQLKAPVKAFMRTDVKTITPDKSPIQAARTMVRYDIGRLPVVENDKIIGIITRFGFDAVFL